ncbi:MAG TPA: NUDIX domain-containing protein [Burkholderiaceae bacterium]|nr:NUDIX domain-containing protein [Burkholderiaceae bacterium]
MSAASRPVTEVAVGVLIRADGAVLLADRPAGKPYAGYWEFPGGKIEPGETVAVALARELHEELGLDIGPALPWVTFEFDYPHAYVRLHFCRVFEWRGTPHPHEGQRLGFFAPGDGWPEPLLPAAIPTLRWLQLPRLLVYADSYSAAAALLERTAGADAGLWLPPPMASMPADQLTTLVDKARRRRMPILADPMTAGRLPSVDGIVLEPEALARCSQRPSPPWVGAVVSTHEELTRAAGLEFDFVVLRALPEESAQPRNPLGWERFRALAKNNAVPAYAMGSLKFADLAAAMVQGAQGIVVA